MSTKAKIGQLERTLNKSNGRQVRTFIVPHCRDGNEFERVKKKVLKDNGFDENNNDLLYVFVIDFAMAA